MICQLLKALFNCEKKSENEPFQDNDPKWLDVAYKELGVSEISGSANNKRIVGYHLATSLEASDDETAWCSSFINWCFKQSGLEGTNSAMARSWMKWGEGIHEPKRGSVVVFWTIKETGWTGHVGFYIKSDSKYIHVLGGNQSNAVSISKYPRARLLGFRSPKNYLNPELSS